MRFRCKVAGIQKLNLRVRQVFAIRFGSRWDEKGIVFTPDCEEGRLVHPKIRLKLRIEFYVGRVVQKQIKLDLLIARAFEQRRVQSVRFRRYALWICDSVRVLPASSFKRKNIVAEHLSVLWRGFGPIFSDRAPSIT